MASIGTKSYDAVVAQKVIPRPGRHGPAMAGHLARAGHHVTVYNRTPAKAQAWPPNSAAAMPPRRAKQSRAPRSCSPASATTTTCAAWCWADGAFAGMAPGAVFVDHTTASADVARELYVQARELGLNFIDAPVSGGQAGAVNGALTIMCGGEQAVFDAIKPVAQAFGRAVTRVGAPAPASLPRWSTRSASQASCRASRKPWLSARRPTST